MKLLNLATLFSGIGAPEQGADRVYDSVNTVFACEFDKFARQSYESNYNIDSKHFHKDVNDLDATPYHGEVDILVGGSPCQDFSIAGKGEGFDGLRGSLTGEFVRVISEVMPPVFIFENVPGILRAEFKNGLKAFIQELRDIGYHLHIEMANTKGHGVPQSRNRYWIVGFLDGDAYKNFEFAPTISLEKRLKDVLEDNVDEKYYLSQKALDGFAAHSKRHKEASNGFKFQPTDGGGYGDVHKHKSRGETNRQLHIKGYP